MPTFAKNLKMKNLIILIISLAVFFSACISSADSTENKADTVTEEKNKNGNIEKNVAQKKTLANANNKRQKKASNKKEVTGSGKINWVWCKRMDRDTFENPEIAEYVNKNFYAVKLNAETEETITFKGKNYDFVKTRKRGHNLLAKELLKGRLSYPTISFLDESLNLINAFPGYKSPPNFDALMNYINSNEFSKMGFTQYKASFKSNIPEVAKSPANKKQKTATIKQKVNLKSGANKNIKLKNVITNKGKVDINTKSQLQNDTKKESKQ